MNPLRYVSGFTFTSKGWWGFMTTKPWNATLTERLFPILHWRQASAFPTLNYKKAGNLSWVTTRIMKLRQLRQLVHFTISMMFQINVVQKRRMNVTCLNKLNEAFGIYILIYIKVREQATFKTLGITGIHWWEDQDWPQLLVKCALRGKLGLAPCKVWK